jgi:1-acyl-sn-glycerol-3-phosphate acyltransferase
MSPISILLLVALLSLKVFIGFRLYHWYKEGQKLQVSGYMTEGSTKIARWTFKAVCWVGTRLLVGPLWIRGQENTSYKGRGLVLPNHRITWDFGVVGKAVPYGYRQLSKAAEIKHPVIATLAAWIGTVGVQVEGGKSQDGSGNAIVETGAKILANSSGSRLLLFPQGKLFYDAKNEPASYRTGATRMMHRAAEIVGDDPLFVQPVGIHYITDKREATMFQRITYPLGLQLIRTFRYVDQAVDADGKPLFKDGKPVWDTKKKKMVLYGAVVVIGKPIPYADLPKDPREAIEYIRVRIVAAVEEAKTVRAVA